MKNLEQIRALNAVNVKIDTQQGDSGSVAKKVPSLIINNGLLATAAFAQEKGQEKKGYAQVFEHIINHLADKRVGLLSPDVKTLGGFIEFLAGIEADKYRLIVAETMAYLNYLRRFAE